MADDSLPKKPQLKFSTPAIAEAFSHEDADTQALLTEGIRRLAEKGIFPRITSTYRSPAHNKAVGGVSGSLHTQGKAFDLGTRDLTPAQRQEMYKTFSEIPGAAPLIEHAPAHLHIGRHGATGLPPAETEEPPSAVDFFNEKMGKPKAKSIETPPTAVDFFNEKMGRPAEMTLEETPPSAEEFFNEKLGGKPPPPIPEKPSTLSQMFSGAKNLFKKGVGAEQRLNEVTERGPEEVKKSLGLSPEEVKGHPLKQIGAAGLDLTVGQTPMIKESMKMMFPFMFPETLKKEFSHPVDSLVENVKGVYDKFLKPVGQAIYEENPITLARKTIQDVQHYARTGEVPQLPDLEKKIGNLVTLGGLVGGLRGAVKSGPEITAGEDFVPKAGPSPGEALHDLLNPKEAAQVSVAPKPKVVPMQEAPTQVGIHAEEPTQLNALSQLLKGEPKVIPKEMMEKTLPGTSEKTVQVRTGEAPTEKVQLPVEEKTQRLPMVDETPALFKGSQEEALPAPAAENQFQTRQVQRMTDELLERRQSGENIQPYLKQLYQSEAGMKVLANLEAKGVQGVRNLYKEYQPGVREYLEKAPATKKTTIEGETPTPEIAPLLKGAQEIPDRGVYLGSGLGGLQGMFEGSSKRNLAAGMTKDLKGNFAVDEAELARKGAPVARGGYAKPPIKLEEGPTRQAIRQMGDPGLMAHVAKGQLSVQDLERMMEKADNQPRGPLAQNIIEPTKRLLMEASKEARPVERVAESYRPVRKLIQRTVEERLTPEDMRVLQSNPKIREQVTRGSQFMENYNKGVINEAPKYGMSIKQRENYLTYIRQEGLWDQIKQGKLGKLYQQIKDKLSGDADIVNPLNHPDEPTAQFLKKRTSQDLDNIDIIDGMKAYARQWAIAKRAASELPKMRATVKALREEGQNAAADLAERYIDEHLLGRPTPINSFVNANFGPLVRAVGAIKNLSESTISAMNPRIYLKHAFSYMNPSSVAGIKNTLVGTTKALFDKSTQDFWKANSPEVEARTSRMESYSPGIFGKLDKYSHWALNHLDYKRVMAAHQSVFEYAKNDLKLPDEAALDFANKWAPKVSGSLQATTKAELLRGPVGKIVPFQRYSFSNFNFLTRDIPRMAKYASPEGAKFLTRLSHSTPALASLARYGIDIYAANAIMHSMGLPSIFHPEEMIPLVRSFMGPEGNPFMQNAAIAAMAGIAKATYGAYVLKDPKEVGKGSRQFVQALKSLGIPPIVATSSQTYSIMNNDQGVVKNYKGRPMYKVEGKAEVARSALFGPSQTKAGQEFYNKREQEKEKMESLKKSVPLGKSLGYHVKKVFNPNAKEPKELQNNRFSRENLLKHFQKTGGN